MTRKCTVFVYALFVFFCFSNAVMAGAPEDLTKDGARISLNLKGSKFGDVLRALAQLYTLNYSISSSAPVASGSYSGTPPSNQSQSPLSPQPVQNSGSGHQASQNINDITVNFAYKGDSVDEAVQLLCRGADVFCEKKTDLWVISRHEVYIIDKDVFFTYSVSGGGGSIGGSTSTPQSSGSSVPATTSSVSGGVAAPSSTGAAGAVTSGSSVADSIGISGNFDDFVQFVKTFLSKDGYEEKRPSLSDAPEQWRLDRKDAKYVL